MDRKVFSWEDTIASIATFPAQAAVGMIKISGNRAIDIVSQVFLPRRRKDLTKAKTYTLHYGWIVDKETSEEKGFKIIDEVLVGLMRAPYSYTRQDVVEIYSHSGQLVLNTILELVLRKGARLAEPGEFTRRAFLMGRIDLVQAEAVLDIVNASVPGALRMGVSQLQGNLSRRIEVIKKEVEDLCILLEAELSFPEEVRIERRKVKEVVRRINKEIESLLKNSERARLLREGIRCVICGRANVGKSSLLNMLLKEEKVIVTHLPGTTRDVVEESINIKGLPFRISDTAGILEAKDLISQKAIQKSYKKIEEANLVLLVLDASSPLKEEDLSLINKVKEKKVVLVINKIDLKKRLDEERLKKYNFPIVRISSLKKIGLEELEETLFETVVSKGLDEEIESSVSNLRHINILKSIQEILREVESYFKTQAPFDFIYWKLREILEEVWRLSGEKVSSDILEEIFNKFCIGK